jgi:hypothetical protein
MGASLEFGVARTRVRARPRSSAELSARSQGTFINVSSSDLGAFSRFAMTIQVTADDQNAPRDFAEGASSRAGAAVGRRAKSCRWAAPAR